MSKFYKALNDDNEFINFLTNEEEYEIENRSIYDYGFSQGSMNEKKDIALNFLKMGLSIEDIVKGTGLSKEEIEVLKKEKLGN